MTQKDAQKDPNRQPSRFTVEVDGLDLSRQEVDEVLNEITKVAADKIRQRKKATTTGEDDLKEFGQWGSFNQWGSFAKAIAM